MSYLEYNTKYVPTGLRKVLHLNWPIILLLIAVASAGFLMLYSVAGGSMTPWVEPQLQRFALGMALMLCVAMVPIWFWRNMAFVAYGGSLLLLLGVEFFGEVRMGAQRWIDIGFMRLQPSELTKITLVMFLAAYYDWLPNKKTSHPLWVLLPVFFILAPTMLVFAAAWSRAEAVSSKASSLEGVQLVLGVPHETNGLLHGIAALAHRSKLTLNSTHSSYTAEAQYRLNTGFRA